MAPRRRAGRTATLLVLAAPAALRAWLREPATAAADRAFFSMEPEPAPEPPEPPKPAYVLRVCGKCVDRKVGGGYNPGTTLKEMQAGAAAAGWPAPEVEMGKCTGNCKFGPTVRLVKGEFAMPVVVEDMDDQEKEMKSFIRVSSEMDAQRAFGLASRHIMSAKDEDEEEPELP